MGKGRVSCRSGKLGVWGIGGAPQPRTFGPCPRGLLPVSRADAPAAGRAALRFVRTTCAGMVPAPIAAAIGAFYVSRTRAGWLVWRRVR